MQCFLPILPKKLCFTFYNEITKWVFCYRYRWARVTVTEEAHGSEVGECEIGFFAVNTRMWWTRTPKTALLTMSATDCIFTSDWCPFAKWLDSYVANTGCITTTYSITRFLCARCQTTVLYLKLCKITKETAAGLLKGVFVSWTSVTALNWLNAFLWREFWSRCLCMFT